MSNIFELDDRKLIEKFVNGSNQLLVSENLRLEVSASLSQLMTHHGESVAIMYLQNKPRTVILNNNSPFAEFIDSNLIDRDFVLIGDATRAGFTEYKYYVTPAGYRVWYTDPSILWKKWWPTERFQNKQRFNMDILVNIKDNWYPIQNINVHSGTFTIKTIAGQLVLKRDNKVLWLAQIMQESVSIPAAENIHKLPQTALQYQTQPKYLPTDIAKKIQQKQSEINSDTAWTMIKKLEQKLQEQIKLCNEAEEKFNRSEYRAIIAEQQLKVIYRYLDKIGVNPQDIYDESQKSRTN